MITDKLLVFLTAWILENTEFEKKIDKPEFFILTKQEINEDITDFSGKTIYDYSKMSRNLLIKKIIETSNFNN